jgi:hypothetical protein
MFLNNLYITVVGMGGLRGKPHTVDSYNDLFAHYITNSSVEEHDENSPSYLLSVDKV